ncbi:ABC transporter permease [Mycobacterium sp. C31M]
MARYLLGRIATAVLVLFAASVVIFSLLQFIPGDPATAILGADATPEQLAALRGELGLDLPVAQQYWHWLSGVLTGDLGQSFGRGGPIADLLADGLRNTLVLAATALMLAVATSLAISTAAVRWPNRALTAVVNAANTLAVALPTFVTGVLLVLVFALLWPVFPAMGLPPDGLLADPWITAQYLLLPAVCLALPVGAALTRFLTEALRTELRAPYTVTARALGISEWRIITRGALRNAAPTAVTVLGLQTGSLLSGAVIVEAIFAWPGIGGLLQEGINRRDYPLVQIVLLVSVAIFVVLQLITDQIHALLDPRIRIGTDTRSRA